MKRVVSLWFPYWPSERLARRSPPAAAPADAGAGSGASAGTSLGTGSGPFVLAAAGQGGVRVTAVSREAAALGLVPGMTLADARALQPGLAVVAADPAADAGGLAALADWCIRFTPFVALDGDDGLVLDVSGCARLHGGEAALLARVVGAVRRLGLTVHGALADTPGAAWAAARFMSEAAGEGGALVPPGAACDALGPLPVAALRLPADTAGALERLGLRRVADVMALPRAPLAARFGAIVGCRIDRALGREAEAISPRRPPPYAARRVFAEPLIDHAGVVAAVADLVAELCRRLEGEGRGLRRLELALYRVDGVRRALTVGAARPTRDPAHLERLLAVRLEALDLGFGVEVACVAALVTEPLAAAQTSFVSGDAAEAGDLAAVIDCLVGRLGPTGVVRLAPRESHVPERAVVAVPAMAPPAGRPWRAEVARPLRLFPRPERIEAVAMVPDAPPLLFRWRGRAYRVLRAEGPERLAAEWWRAPRGRACDAADYRDYYRIEDAAGARFWLYRRGPYDAGGQACWYLHGVFA